jgi:hypothetical protein
MCVSSISNLYDIAQVILGCNLPEEFSFLYAVMTLVIGIVFVVSIFAPFWIVYKIFE